jgi:hypothetical protein
MSTRASDSGDEPAADQPMLAVLSNRGRNVAALSSEQERLVDHWVLGRLSPEDVTRAEALVKANVLAAERVLERRLITAAERSAAVPAELTARVIKANAPAARPADVGGWLRAFGRRSWIALAGAVALASIVAVTSLSLLQPGEPIQIALATISDRDALFERSDIRMRGASPQPSPSDLRFRNVEIPIKILKNLGSAPRDIEPYLPGAEGARRPLRVFLDAILKQRIDAAGGNGRVAVRIYNLDDPRSADIGKLLEPAPAAGRAYLLTVKP